MEGDLVVYFDCKASQKQYAAVHALIIPAPPSPLHGYLLLFLDIHYIIFRTRNVRKHSYKGCSAWERHNNAVGGDGEFVD